MGQVNDEGSDGTGELPKLEVHGEWMPHKGLKNVPFLTSLKQIPRDIVSEATFSVPVPTGVRHDDNVETTEMDFTVIIPNPIATAWLAAFPMGGPTIAEQLEHTLEICQGMGEDLEAADRKQQQTVRVADHMAAIIEMALRCMGDKARAVEVIPDTGLSIGELMASAVAWWDQERHAETGE